MAKVLKASTKEPQAAASTGKSGSWKCECGFLNFAFRQNCKDCACAKPAAGSEGLKSPAPATAGPAEGGLAAMQVEASLPEPAITPEQKVKHLDSPIKAVKEAVPSKAKDASLALYAQEMQQAKSEILQARPLPSRLQAAVSRQAAAAKERAAAVATDVQFQQISQAKGKLAAEAIRREEEADREVLEIQALLGRPQLEAGAAAAVSLCLSMLKENGLAEHLLESFDGALRAALSGRPEVVTASSPFAVGGPSPVAVEHSAPLTPGLSQVLIPTPFSQGGSFLHGGASPFAAAAAAASASETAQRREEALVSIKARVGSQQLKLGALEKEAKLLREAAQASAANKGDDVESTEQAAFVKETEVDTERSLLVTLEQQQSVLERDAFQKALGQDKDRPGPF
jgi:hypothetical protein